jgi:hypothetical protein
MCGCGGADGCGYVRIEPSRYGRQSSPPDNDNDNETDCAADDRRASDFHCCSNVIYGHAKHAR